jgi:Glycosyl hydrolases family 16
LVETIGSQNYIGVDYTNTYDPNGAGRPSVRIQSQNVYNHGLFILDLAHMPASTCGTWPAFWTFSQNNYPAEGEIDILENMSEATQSLNALHSSPGFSVVGNQKGSQQSDTQNTYNCDDTAQSSAYGSQSLNQGCAATTTTSGSYGSAMNAAGGGVYAMEWTSDVIRMWSWAAGSVPGDIASGKPVPSSWGTPGFTTAQGVGNVDDHFKNHQIVLDTTFCGSWAGQDIFWQQTSCYDKVQYPTCNDYVAKNPSKYKDAYWLVNSLKVYQETEDVPPPPPAQSSSSTSAPVKTSR